MASPASAARDIPTASLSRDNLAAQLQKAKLEPIDSDLDLQDDQSGNEGSSAGGFESAGAITSTMLTRYHLPEILLNHGPLAIRHIMGYLTTSAKLTPNSRDSSVAPGIPIAKRAMRTADRARANASSSIGDSVVFSHDDRDIYMAENEADNMSLDDAASASCSEAPEDDDMVMRDDPEDVTDDEDWAAIGAAALRAGSYQNQAAAVADRNYLSPSVYNGGGMRSFSASAGMARSLQPANIDFSAFGSTSDAQEREAVEALLQLRSV
ncbi:unnamed protein product [Parascedosporium putredinis]|uniref:Sin3 binding protein n=1 Tax=Parascedosporium putredinis TaxID=1442378 RepID=A0A9P1GXG9_9PEZI|nr:unnamed protein product [Parascedosporium putredinis]CAI7989237.1 unnamed protein product [Parascedosporium putredinis]